MKSTIRIRKHLKNDKDDKDDKEEEKQKRKVITDQTDDHVRQKMDTFFDLLTLKSINFADFFFLLQTKNRCLNLFDMFSFDTSQMKQYDFLQQKKGASLFK